jgi:hypothetical protein
MKRITVWFAVSTMLSAMFYVGGSIGSANWNPIHWTENIRSTVATFWLLIDIIFTFFVLAAQEEELPKL